MEVILPIIWLVISGAGALFLNRSIFGISRGPRVTAVVCGIAIIPIRIIVLAMLVIVLFHIISVSVVAYRRGTVAIDDGAIRKLVADRCDGYFERSTKARAATDCVGRAVASV